MAASSEEFEHNPNDSGESAANAVRLIYELRETVTDVRDAARDLGMFAAYVYHVPLNGAESFRIVGGLIGLKGCDPSQPYLYVVLNDIKKAYPESAEQTVAYTEEFVVGEVSLAYSPDVAFIDTDDKLLSDSQPPLIWQDSKSEWALYRGKQLYGVPQLPNPDADSYIIENQLTEARRLSSILRGLTPGNEDARYEVEGRE